MHQILRVNTQGSPTHWLSKEEAATLYVQGKVCWELGDTKLEILGGFNNSGLQSRLKLSPVVATFGAYNEKNHRSRLSTGSVALNNRTLFKRDNFTCMYCGERFAYKQLTRDHIVPKSKGGANTWRNVVAACKRCNHAKGCKLLDDFPMPLIAVPFVPNVFEGMYLLGRHIVADQMQYLSKKFSGNRQWRLN